MNESIQPAHEINPSPKSKVVKIISLIYAFAFFVFLVVFTARSSTPLLGRENLIGLMSAIGLGLFYLFPIYQYVKRDYLSILKSRFTILKWNAASFILILLFMGLAGAKSPGAFSALKGLLTGTIIAFPMLLICWVCFSEQSSKQIANNAIK